MSTKKSVSSSTMTFDKIRRHFAVDQHLLMEKTDARCVQRARVLLKRLTCLPLTAVRADRLAWFEFEGAGIRAIWKDGTKSTIPIAGAVELFEIANRCETFDALGIEAGWLPEQLTAVQFKALRELAVLLHWWWVETGGADVEV